MAVTKCRVKTSEASKKTIVHRTRSISQLRTYVSGGDVSVQMRSELQALSKNDREELMQKHIFQSRSRTQDFKRGVTF